jgi:hypothetical protein
VVGAQGHEDVEVRLLYGQALNSAESLELPGACSSPPSLQAPGHSAFKALLTLFIASASFGLGPLLMTTRSGQ